ncbi:hypothetical protein KEM54_004388 [Ascosphaera aggregata]|nr:hypothetical protein KEM54_004388 [Ascosphaera aggregata]
MAPSLREQPSCVRPTTRDRPSTRDAAMDSNLIIPSRTSSLHSRVAQPLPSSLHVKPVQDSPKTLTHAYMVCGVGREPSQWIKAPPPTQGKIQHMKGAVPQFWLPEILGSSPRLDQDNDIARALHAAMRACFPHDVEICTGKSQPHCVHHSFVLQQDSTHTLYGIALRVWSRADKKRAETIRDLRSKTEPDFFDNPEETYWIPYCLSFLSRYPLYNLLGDYLRGMWIHWDKATNLFYAEEVSRILSFPAPRLNDLVRIDMKDYALCYQFPSSPSGFQNFAMWPLFTCLSIPNIVGVIEAAVSPARRVIFVSHYPAMLTVAAETVRFCVRVYEWSGLYCPVVHARHINDLAAEPGPYILGVTSECRTLFSAPTDTLVVDLDKNFVLTSSPPSILKPGQRTKMINRLTQALNGDVPQTGVPTHLRSAYAGGKLIPAGQIVVMRGEVERVEDPDWWNQDGVMAVMDHVCEKLGRNKGVKALFGGSTKKSLMTKVSTRHLNEILRERNQYSRDATEAWQDFINLKGRMDTEVLKVTKRNDFLVEELETWKCQFQRFQTFAEHLTKETTDLKVKIEHHKKENRRLYSLLETHRDEVNRLSLRLAGTEKQRDDALEALVLQQEIAEELERERKRNAKELAALEHTNHTLVRQRDEAQRVVLHLRSLITGQAHHMEHIVRSIKTDPDITGLLEDDIDESFAKERELIRQGGLDTLNETQPSPHDNNGNGPEDGEHVHASPGIEDRLLNLERRRSRYGSGVSNRHLSIADVADRHLRDKTDAIADMIRSISEQCAAAVEGLQVAHSIDNDDDDTTINLKTEPHSHGGLGLSTGNSPDGSHGYGRSYAASASESERECEIDSTTLTTRDSNTSSVPSTPDLTRRCSTSLSYLSNSTTNHCSSTFDRGSYSPGDLPTRIVEDDAEQDAMHESNGCSSLLGSMPSRGAKHKSSALRAMTRSASATPNVGLSI